MTRSRFTTPIALAGVLSLACGPAFAQQIGAPPAQPRRDVGKGVIELPTKNLVAGFTAPASSANGGLPVLPNFPEPAADNPAVPPGKVHWHVTFEEACQAAQKSGKPVLLFQMLGRLDQQFC
jgi:hypothetical protein